MRNCVILLVFIPCLTQTAVEKIADYILLGPNLMRDARYLYHSSRDIEDYKKFEQEILASRKPWYVRWLSIFEPREERKIERLWYRVQKQTAFLKQLKESYANNTQVTTILQPIDRLDLQTQEIIDAPVPLGSLTKDLIYKKSKTILGEIIFAMLTISTDLALIVHERDAVMQHLQESIAIQKAYDALDFSAIELWYASRVHKQLISYFNRLFTTIMPMSSK